MSQEIPSVSVGMPVYNGESHLRAAIESILGQTFRDLELIISDNASTDGTESLCREFAEKDPRVRYYRNPKNLGISENYNVVFRRANGRYFKWASSNDFCDRHFLEACVKVLEERPDAVLVYPRTRLIRGELSNMEDFEDGLNLTQERACERFRAFYERIQRIHLNNVMNGLVRVEVLRRTPLIVPYRGSDVVLMNEVTLYGKFVEVHEFMFFRRMDRYSATAMQSREEVIRYYDPEQRRRMRFQRWKRYRGRLSAVVRAPLPVSEKVCLYRFLWQCFLRDWGYLAREIREAAAAGP